MVFNRTLTDHNCLLFTAQTGSTAMELFLRNTVIIADFFSPVNETN
jgi:hypothetical protein